MKRLFNICQCCCFFFFWSIFRIALIPDQGWEALFLEQGVISSWRSDGHGDFRTEALGCVLPSELGLCWGFFRERRASLGALLWKLFRSMLSTGGQFPTCLSETGHTGHASVTQCCVTLNSHMHTRSNLELLYSLTVLWGCLESHSISLLIKKWPFQRR